LKALETIHYHYVYGLLDPQLWAGWRDLLHHYIACPGIRFYLTRRNAVFSERFRKFISELEPLEQRNDGRKSFGHGNRQLADDARPRCYPPCARSDSSVHPSHSVLTSDRLDTASGASLFFKCENFQKVGAFKARGATNAVFSLDDETAQRGVATHSSGTMRRLFRARRSCAALRPTS